MALLARVPAEAVRELRARLRAAPDVPPYRALDGAEASWEASPAGTETSLRRFLAARKGDVDKAMAMYTDCLAWRRRAEILADGRRFRRIATGSDGVPVIMIEFLWGYFLEGATAFDCLRATLVFVEQEIARGEQAGAPQFCIISYGGPPPIEYAAALGMVLTKNYPERLQRAVIYPVPRLGARLTRLFLWFADRDTREKIAIHWDEDAFLDFVRLRHENVPQRLWGGVDGSKKWFMPDSQTRIARAMRSGLAGGLGPAQSLMAQLEEHPVRAQLSRACQNTAPPTKQASRPGRHTCLPLAACCPRREIDNPRSDREGGLTVPIVGAASSPLQEPTDSCDKLWPAAKDAGKPWSLPSNAPIAVAVALLLLMLRWLLETSDVGHSH